MKIYKQETALAELIQKDTSIAYQCNIINSSDNKEFSDSDKVKACVNSGQPDLYYIEAVLVSTNWNDNDDVFSINDTWASRNTPVDKQFNFMHKESDIIGHITSSYITVGDEVYASEDQIPEFFDIVVGSVLYKKWSDPELQKRMDKIIAEIPEGKWFVSMEALFTGFDYAILKDSEAKIIARDNESSFLTKHLRAYGGTGVYNDYRIGRVLKNITFSGKGLVDRPANKRSLIKSYSFNGAFASYNETFGSTLMSDTVAKTDYDSVKAELNNLKNDLDKSKAEKIQKYEETIASLTEKNSVLASEKSEVETKLSNTEALSVEKTDKIEALEVAMKDKSKSMDDMKEHMEKMKKEKAKSERMSQLVGLGCDPAKAEKTVESFSEASDSMFNEVLALYKDKEVKDDKAEDKKDKSKAETEEANADDLEDVQVEASVNLNQEEGEADASEQLRTKASAWLESSWNNK